MRKKIETFIDTQKNQIIVNKIYLDWQKKSIKCNHLNASKIILEHVESFVDETI